MILFVSAEIEYVYPLLSGDHRLLIVSKISDRCLYLLRL
jgi:hypothetical protein